MKHANINFGLIPLLTVINNSSGDEIGIIMREMSDSTYESGQGITPNDREKNIEDKSVVPLERELHTQHITDALGS